MATATKAEQRKRLMLAALGGLFLIVLIYQLFLSSPSKPVRKVTNTNTSAAATTTAPITGGASQAGAKPVERSKPNSAQAEEIAMTLMQDLTPLELGRSVASGSVEVDKERGNIFQYYIPPPPPQPKPPDPPPITLTGVSPATAVAGTPRKVALTITGSKIPEDAQLFFDGAPKAARRISESQMTADLEPGEYTYARSINITVKSKSDPKLFSTQTSFNVQPAPEPQFRYIGRLGEQGVFELTASKEIKRFSRGDVIMNQWRIDSISDQGVDLMNTQYEIKRRVPLQEKTR